MSLYTTYSKPLHEMVSEDTSEAIIRYLSHDYYQEITKMSNPNYAHVGIYFPKDTLKRVDQLRGRYHSRNRFFLKIIEEYLAAQGERSTEKK